MVLKLRFFDLIMLFAFENDVKMYGTQTEKRRYLVAFRFENDVKMYGTQTVVPIPTAEEAFENDVKMYGTQTFSRRGQRSEKV